MSKSFEVALNSTPETLLSKAREVAIKEGVELNGDVHSGSFSGKGLEGEFRVQDKTVLLTLKKKPKLVPWSMVEKKVKAFFS